jgi:endonuclease YncB( thermonuclease family)
MSTATPGRARLYRSAGMIAIGLFILMKVASDIAGRSEALRGRAEVLDGATISVEGVQVRLQGVAAPEIAHESVGIQAEVGGEDAAPSCATWSRGKPSSAISRVSARTAVRWGCAASTGAMWRPRSSPQASPATARATPAGAMPALSG